MGIVKQLEDRIKQKIAEQDYSNSISRSLDPGEEEEEWALDPEMSEERQRILKALENIMMTNFLPTEESSEECPTESSHRSNCNTSLDRSAAHSKSRSRSGSREWDTESSRA